MESGYIHHSAIALARQNAQAQAAKDKSMPGYAKRSAVLTLINETLSRTVAPVKQFLGLLV
jgi:hypothetical protein